MEAYRDACESGVIPDSFELNKKTTDIDRKRIGFYFLILKNVTDIDSDEDISSKIIDTEYSSKILNRTEDELIKDILEQIHTNAEICTKKSKYYNSGVKFVFVATVLYIACMGIGVL